MGDKKNGYKAFESFLTILLLIDVVVFLLYLIFAGAGVLALKIILAILGILIAAAGFFFLYSSREILRQRSLWLTCGFGSVALLTIVSLICNFPAP